ncbi:centromere protein P isoform X2 [Numida meleagris]|uniref:centromere protein P isoform X2 n=1 Tax=Numida meleagris TaxID=8996 RepID=UPI000B3D9CC6|nr:centromere protein P isoform X2 [Numida meleagris]
MDNSIYQVYEDEIQLLEEEIKLLAEKYEDIQQESTFFSEEEVLTSIKLFQREFQGEHKGHGPPLDLKAELESLERDLSFLMKFTGIQITSHSKKTLEKTANRTVQKHKVSGNCWSLPFCLEFQLLEMKSKENVSAAVTDLSIVIESGQYSELSKFVTSAEEHGNLLLFFRSLLSYAEWCEHRRCTFLHFKEKRILAQMFVFKGQCPGLVFTLFLPCCCWDPYTWRKTRISAPFLWRARCCLLLLNFILKNSSNREKKTAKGKIKITLVVFGI